MHCANCGNLLPPQAKVCPNCGTRVPSDIPTSPPNITPSEQTSYGGFSSFQEQFQFPEPPSSPARQFSQPAQSQQPAQPPLSSQPQMSFGDAMQAPPQPFAGATPHPYADTTQQNIPIHNQPPYPAMPLQSPLSRGQYMQFGPLSQPSQIGQVGYSSQSGPMGQSGQPGSQWQPPQPAQSIQPPRRRSTALIIALIAAIVLVIAGSFLIYYVGVAHPAQLHAQATTTVVTQLHGTALAHTHATGTALAQANATTTAVAVAAAQVQATMTAYVNMYTQVASGTPAINDQLTGNDANNWGTYSNNGSGCGFSNGTLHATGDGGICIAQATNYGDFAYQAKVNIVKGSTTTSGGLMFRLDRSTLKFYAFGIDTNGGYFLALFQVGSSKTTFKNLTNGINQAITPGFNVTNTLAILARGSNFYLYVNNQYITQFSDTNSAAGAIGVFGSDNASGVDVSFTNAEVWRA